MSEKPIVRVTRRLPGGVEQALEEHFDLRWERRDGPLDPEELRAAFRRADAVLCTVTDNVDAECFAQEGRRARIVANFGVGVNHIDLAAARAAGVVVTNTPDVLTDDTADLTILLMLAVMRRAGEGERELREGRWTGWRPTHLLGTRLGGKTLGIVGMGRIGSAVARRARDGFGMRVVALTRSGRIPLAAGAVDMMPNLDALLEQSDVVSLHCPATPETRGMMGAAAFERMKRGAYFINTARGDLVNETALVQALTEGRLAGAGLDVYAEEPRVHPLLLGREDVVLLPHLGSATRETRDAMGLRALANLLAFFDGRPPPDRLV